VLFEILLWAIIIASIAAIFLKRMSAVQILVLAILLTFGVQIASLFIDGRDVASFWGLYTGNFKLSTLFSFISSMYLHGSILHLIGNVLFFFFLGTALEEKSGKRTLITAFFAGGVAASCVHWLLNLHSPTILIGASGAISAVMGTLLIMHPKEKTPMLLGPLILSKVPVWLSVGIFFAFETIMVFVSSQDNIAHEAHVAGLVFGIAYGGLLLTANKGKKAKITPAGARRIDELATDEHTKKAVDNIRSDDPESVFNAWIEHLEKRGKCPDCQSPLVAKGDTLECTLCKARFHL